MPLSDPQAALRAHFGFPAFRPGQEEAVRAALEGRDVLVVMPTGAGKSLCYQLPALMREELTLVVSPLVSLMEDQVQALARRAPGRVALVNAQRSAGENDAALAAAVRGELRLLYVAPERFASPGFARALKPARVGLFVVDEAHCVSQWGHDFRPDYFRLADAARWLGARSVLASTATATPSVAADVVARLRLRRPVRVLTGFDRPNLAWAVVPSSPRSRESQLITALREPDATPAIVYAGTRRAVDELAEALAGALARPVLAYHAGLDRHQRAAAQRRFMTGEVDVVVATNAFGMGVDKADVRTVVHATVPPSVEAYYQEAGRAGRDGAPARAVLLAGGRDKGLHVFFIQRAEVTPAQVERIARRLEAAAGGAPLPGAAPPLFDLGVDELAGEAPRRDGGLGGPGAAGAGAAADGDGADRVRAVLGALARAGVIHLAPTAVDRVRGRLLTGFDARARAQCRAMVLDAHRARWKRYRAIWGFVEGSGCRRAAILAHFGDADGLLAPRERCCDVCDPDVVPEMLRRAPALAGVPPRDLAATIVALVGAAEPGLTRERAVEALRGARSLELRRHGHDGLPGYGACPHLRPAQVLEAIDALVATGRLRLGPGVFPRLRVAGEERAAA